MGQDLPESLIWISGSNLISKKNRRPLNNSAFEVGASIPELMHIPLGRQVMICLYHEGREYDFNFTHFWKLINSSFNCRKPTAKSSGRLPPPATATRSW